MSWMKYNKETGQIDLLPYISELSGFHAIVMDEHTWSNVICKRSASAAPGKAKGRKTKFLANLFDLLKAQDETRPITVTTFTIMYCISSFPQMKPTLLSVCNVNQPMNLSFGMRSFLFPESNSANNQGNEGVKFYPLGSGNSFIHTYNQEDSKHELETL